MTARHLLTLLLAIPALAAFGQQPDIRRESAPYVFLGTVVKGAPGSLTRSQDSVLVTVNEIYLQKGTFENQRGRQVEVVGATARLQIDSQYIFYTEPVSFGKMVSVRLIDVTEPNRSAASQPAPAARQEITEAYARREIADRAALAEIVVLGTVAEIRQLPEAPRVESEHDPDFRIARVRIERVLKGKAAGEIEFVFAASRDVQWYRSPKLRVGQRAVFLLQHPAPDIVRLRVNSQRYTVLDARDVRPPSEIALVEAVLKGGRQ